MALARVWGERLGELSAPGVLIERAVHTHNFISRNRLRLLPKVTIG
jgi:hypothetical protein